MANATKDTAIRAAAGMTLPVFIQRMAKFPASGEINRKVADAGAAIAAISDEYQADAERVDTTDGISMDFGSWRFNLRSSNTGPVIRLNVESRGDE